MEDNAPVQVPPGYALVPVKGAGHGTDRRDWTYAVPPFDPNDSVEYAWSYVLRWPRYVAVAFLYVTQSWKHTAVLLTVAIMVYLAATH